jgi:hypothetical protein
MRSRLAFALLPLFLSLAWGCDLRSGKPEKPVQTLDDISDKAIESFSRKTIFFGHASVGQNIVQGMKEIAEKDHRFRMIRIVEVGETTDMGAPGFYHAVNGRNGYPKTKCTAFINLLRKNRRGDHLDVGLFKFCYVDIERNSNVQEIFDEYVATIREVRKEFPKLGIVHVTVPLYVHPSGVKGFVKNLLRADTANIKRNRFNELLKSKYSGTDPIYDLARVEYETGPGETSRFSHDGKVYYSLAEAHTDDGGHLNETGRFRAAKELIRTLSKI